MSQNQSPHILGTKALLKALVAAIFIAAIALLTIILPAEYDIDPTGIGQRLGLTALSGTQLASVEQTPEPIETAVEQVESSDTIHVTVPAMSGIEYKLNMDQFRKLTYDWKTDGPDLYFDLHGEPKGDTTGYYESYAIATLTGMEGSFTTPFAGTHGWYWKNSTNQAVTVTLNVKGTYTINGPKP